MHGTSFLLQHPTKTPLRPDAPSIGPLFHAILILVLFVVQARGSRAEFKRLPPTIRDDGNTRYVEVQSYLPLKEITAIIGKDLSVLVSYEDPWYSGNDIEDIAADSWRKDHPNEIGFYVPKWSFLSISYDKTLKQPDAIEAVLRSAVKNYNDSHPGKVFEVIRTGPHNYVIAGHEVSGKAIGDHPISPHFEPQTSAMHALDKIMKACSTSAQAKIEMGTVPLNLLASKITNFKDQTMTCRQWVEKVISATGVDLVYQINDDITDQLYILNIAPPEATVIF